jgi:hypothetical protein
MEVQRMFERSESLIVASKGEVYIKRMITPTDSLVAVNDTVYSKINTAMARTKANRRTTVKAQDL